MYNPNFVQSGDGEKNVHFKFDKYKNNTLIFYKTSTRYAWSGLLMAPSKAHCRFRFKNIKVYFFEDVQNGDGEKNVHFQFNKCKNSILIFFRRKMQNCTFFAPSPKCTEMYRLFFFMLCVNIVLSKNKRT